MTSIGQKAIVRFELSVTQRPQPLVFIFRVRRLNTRNAVGHDEKEFSCCPSHTHPSHGACARRYPIVKRRLDEISHTAADAGQFGPAVRAEELLGKSIGMWIDRSLQLAGQLSDSHITALLELARKQQAEPIDLTDDETDT